MAEAAALFKQFIYHDLGFVFGGFIVLLGLTYAFHGCIPNGWQIAWKEFPTIVLIVFAAYVVGYAVQDIGGVLRLTPTSRFKPRFPLKRLYKCFSQLSWQRPTDPNRTEFPIAIHMSRPHSPEDVL